MRIYYLLRYFVADRIIHITLDQLLSQNYFVKKRLSNRFLLFNLQLQLTQKQIAFWSSSQGVARQLSAFKAQRRPRVDSIAQRSVFLLCAQKG